MRYETQNRLAAEMKARYRRGTLSQNLFRMAYFNFRQNGCSPEKSDALALSVVRKVDPSFEPDRKAR